MHTPLENNHCYLCQNKLEYLRFYYFSVKQDSLNQNTIFLLTPVFQGPEGIRNGLYLVTNQFFSDDHLKWGASSRWSSSDDDHWEYVPFLSESCSKNIPGHLWSKKITSTQNIFRLLRNPYFRGSLRKKMIYQK